MTKPVRIILAVAISAAVCGPAGAGEGQKVYQRCIACHQPGGVGIPGVFPALDGRIADMMASIEGREYITMVLIDGLIGAIEIDGQNFVGAMPAQGLSDGEIVDVIDYIVTGFGESSKADAKPVMSEEEVAGIRFRHSGADSPSPLELRSKVPGLSGQ